MTESFDQLECGTQLHRLGVLVEDVLSCYGIGGADVRLLQYEDNAVYKIVSDKGRFVMRVSVIRGRTAEEQESELEWLRFMHDAGSPRVPVPREMGDARERIVVRKLPGAAEQVTFALFEWIPGEILEGIIDQRVAADVGVLTARLHESSRQFEPSPKFTRPSWGFEDVFSHGQAMTDSVARTRIGADDQAVLRDICSLVQERAPQRSSATWGLTHADLHRGNLLATPDGGVAAIDFDDCGWGYYGLDVATVLSSFFRACREGEYPELVASFFNGYGSVCPPPPSAGHPDDFLVMRDMIILNFVLSSLNSEVRSWGPERARGILNVFREYLSTDRYSGSLVPYW